MAASATFRPSCQSLGNRRQHSGGRHDRDHGVSGAHFGIMTAPRATFEAVARSPRWVGILALTFLVAAVSTAIVL